MKKRDAVSLVNLICGSQIGRGAYRTAFNCRIDESLVIKHEPVGSISNLLEHRLWTEFSFTDIGKWLAPVEWISDDGVWLIQKKTQPIRDSDLPDKIPAIFCDLKLENWGWLDGKVVCHDYGNSLIFSLAGKHGSKLIEANWLK